MSRKRFVVECFWSGYRTNQSRPCHRTVETYKAEGLSKITSVQFTDGTHMFVSVRPCKLRERVDEIHGYVSLLSKIWARGLSGCVKVEDLYENIP